MRTVYLNALYDDGSAHQAVAPLSGATTLRLNRGEDTAVIVIIWTPSGGRKKPAADDTFTIVVKDSALKDTAPALLTVDGEAQPDGSWLCTFDAAGLLSLDPKRYVFTGKLVEASGPTTSYPIPISTLILQPTT